MLISAEKVRGPIEISPSGKVPAEAYEREALLAALQEIGVDGGHCASLASLGLDFGGTPDLGEGNPPKEAEEAGEIPEVDSPLDA